MQRATTLAPLLRDLLVKDPEGRPATKEVRRRLAETAARPPAPPPSETMEFEPEMLAAVGAAPAADDVEDDGPAEPEGEVEATVLDQPPPAAVVPEPEVPGVAAPRAAQRPPERRHRDERAVPVAALAAVALAVVLIIALVGFLAGRDEPDPTVVDESSATTAVEETSPETAEQPAEEPAPRQPPASRGPATAAAPEAAGAVPGNWISYQDPAIGYTVSHPPNWTVEQDGTITNFRDPRTGTYLRIDYTDAPGPSAEQAWLNFEPEFAAENPNYRRIQITPMSFKGYPAALWEYTYTGRGTPLHAYNLGSSPGPTGSP